jgi:hypothetical protein
VTGVRRLLSRLSRAQEGAERTLTGQGVISGLIVAAVLTGIICNLPASEIKRQGMAVAAPIGAATGLGQTWDVFAPNPPRQDAHLHVVVSFADGRQTVWNFPHGDPLVGHYATERWRKVQEYLLSTPSLRPSFARWVARQVAGPEGGAVRVMIVERTVPLPPPGSAAVAGATVKVLYDEKLTGS